MPWQRDDRDRVAPDDRGGSTLASRSATKAGAPAGMGAAAVSRIAAAASLGSKAGVELSVRADGSIAREGADDSLEGALFTDELLLGSSNLGEPFNPLDNVFSPVKDPMLLRRIGLQAEAGFRRGLESAATREEAAQRTQLRADAFAILEQAAIQAIALKDPALSRSLTLGLHSLLGREPLAALRAFVLERVIRATTQGTLPKVAEDRDPAHADQAPFGKEDTLRIQYYADNNGSPLASSLNLMRSLGMKEEKLDEHRLRFTRPAMDGKSAVEIVIETPATYEQAPSLFEKMDDPSCNMIVYAGHAGYGQRTQDAIAKGVRGSGAGKVVVLMQCSGTTDVGPFSRVFPEAQLLSTTEPTTDYWDIPALARIIEGVSAGAGWKLIREQIDQDLEQRRPDDPKNEAMKGYGYSFDAKGHYFYPDQPDRTGIYSDTDGDGLPDHGDRRFDAPLGRGPLPLADHDPGDPHGPSRAAGLLDAVSQLSLILRYHQLLPKAVSEKLGWGAALPIPAGTFVPEPGDLRAFRFTREGAHLQVTVSRSFAGADRTALARMLAYEAGLYLGTEAGLDGVHRSALALTMLERADHQGRFQGESSNIALDEASLLSRYGLSETSYVELSGALGYADDLTPEHTNKMAGYVATHPALARAAEAAPRPTGRALPVPPGLELRLGAYGELDPDEAEKAAHALGIPGTCVQGGRGRISDDQDSATLPPLAGPGGTQVLVSVGLETRGHDRFLVLSASVHEFDVGALAERSARRQLVAFAESAKLDAGGLVAQYDELRRASHAVADALLEVGCGARSRVSLETRVSTWSFRDLRFDASSLVGPAELEAASDILACCYATYDEAFAAQQAFLGWVKQVAPAEEGRLRQLYLTTLGEKRTPANAIAAVLAQLPTDGPGQAPFPFQTILSSPLIRPEDGPLFVRASAAHQQWSPHRAALEILRPVVSLMDAQPSDVGPFFAELEKGERSVLEIWRAHRSNDKVEGMGSWLVNGGFVPKAELSTPRSP